MGVECLRRHVDKLGYTYHQRSTVKRFANG